MSASFSSILTCGRRAAIFIAGLTFAEVLFMTRLTYLAILSIARFRSLCACRRRDKNPANTADIGTATVASVRDGRTVLLADGRELRLAAIEVTDSSRDASATWSTATTLRLEQLGNAPDRYGRLVAFVYGETEQSVQQAWSRRARRAFRRKNRQQSLRRYPVGRRTRQPAERVAEFGPTPISPLCGRNMLPGLGRAGTICAGRRQGLVGA